MAVLAAELVVQWELAVKRTTVWPSTLTGVYWGAWYSFALVRWLMRKPKSNPNEYWLRHWKDRLKIWGA